jgi:membrane protein
VRCFLDHDGFFLAAGLSFYVVVCVVPFILLAIAVGGFLLSDEIVLQRVLYALAEALPVYRNEVEAIITGVVRARGVSGVLGTAILLLFATQCFAATRLVLNRVLGIKGRGLIHGVLFDLGMVVLLTLLFFVAVGATAGFAYLKVSLEARQPLFAFLLEWGSLMLAVLLNMVLFGLVYRFVPLRRASWRSVLAASAAGGVLWEVAKQLFRFYIENIGVYDAVYGSLGVTVALIMWVYYSAIVFVVGAAVIRVLEDRRATHAL